MKGEPLAPETIAERKRRAKIIIEELGHIPLAGLARNHIAEFLSGRSSADVYNAYRSQLSQILKHALSDGKIHANFADEIVKRDGEKKKRRRLEVEAYIEIFEAAPLWLQKSMELGLNLFQRNADLRKLKFSDAREDGHLYMIQSKTRKHGKAAFLRIPLDMPAILSLAGNSSLREIIEWCRDDIACPYILHRKPDRIRNCAEKDHWAQLGKKQKSREFAKVLRSLERFADTPEEEHPTFYECISLGMFLRYEGGWDADSIKALKGHTSANMTMHYLEGHDWTTVEIPEAQQDK